MARWLSTQPEGQDAVDEVNGDKQKPSKWSIGILLDKETDEVPGQCNPASVIQPL